MKKAFIKNVWSSRLKIQRDAVERKYMKVRLANKA